MDDVARTMKDDDPFEAAHREGYEHARHHVREFMIKHIEDHECECAGPPFPEKRTDDIWACGMCGADLCYDRPWEDDR